MKRFGIAIVVIAITLSSCSLLPSKSVALTLGKIPYAWSIPTELASRLTVEIPTNEFALQAQELGAQAQAIVLFRLVLVTRARVIWHNNACHHVPRLSPRAACAPCVTPSLHNTSQGRETRMCTNFFKLGIDGGTLGAKGSLNTIVVRALAPIIRS